MNGIQRVRILICVINWKLELVITVWELKLRTFSARWDGMEWKIYFNTGMGQKAARKKLHCTSTAYALNLLVYIYIYMCFVTQMNPDRFLEVFFSPLHPNISTCINSFWPERTWSIDKHG